MEINFQPLPYFAMLKQEYKEAVISRTLIDASLSGGKRCVFYAPPSGWLNQTHDFHAARVSDQ